MRARTCTCILIFSFHTYTWIRAYVLEIDANAILLLFIICTYATYHEVVALKECRVRSPVMLIRESPQQDTVNVWVAKVQRHDVIVGVGTFVLVVCCVSSSVIQIRAPAARTASSRFCCNETPTCDVMLCLAIFPTFSENVTVKINN